MKKFLASLVVAIALAASIAQAADPQFLIRAPMSVEGQLPTPTVEEGGRRLLNPVRSGRFELTPAGEQSTVVAVEYEDDPGVIHLFTLVRAPAN